MTPHADEIGKLFGELLRALGNGTIAQGEAKAFEAKLGADGCVHLNGSGFFKGTGATG